MKKILFNTFYFLTLSLLMFSCDEPLNFMEVEGLGLVDNENVPAKVFEFLDKHYPEYEERKIKREDICSDSLVFEVELERGNKPDVDIYFDENGNFWFVASKIRIKDLPTAVKERVDTLGANLMVSPKDIELWEFSVDSMIYKLELRSQGANLDVLITADGTIICLDDDSDHEDEGDDDDDGDDDDGDDDDGDDDDGDDDDGDDDDGDDGDDDDKNDMRMVPRFVRDSIAMNYPDYSVEEVETEKSCDGNRYHEVSLESESGPDLELFYSLDWTLQFVKTEMNYDDLPDAVKTTITADYAEFTVDDDIYEMTLEDGSRRFEVELDNSNGRDIEIIFNEDGSIYCEDK